jgi:hypothetical protein
MHMLKHTNASTIPTQTALTVSAAGSPSCASDGDEHGVRNNTQDHPAAEKPCLQLPSWCRLLQREVLAAEAPSDLRPVAGKEEGGAALGPVAGKEEATERGASLSPVAGKRRGDGGRRCPGPVARKDEAAVRGSALGPVVGKRRGPGLRG